MNKRIEVCLLLSLIAPVYGCFDNTSMTEFSGNGPITIKHRNNGSIAFTIDETVVKQSESEDDMQAGLFLEDEDSQELCSLFGSMLTSPAVTPHEKSQEFKNFDDSKSISSGILTSHSPYRVNSRMSSAVTLVSALSNTTFESVHDDSMSEVEMNESTTTLGSKRKR